MRFPYLTSIVVAVAFWFVSGLVLAALGRVVDMNNAGLQFCAFLQFLAAMCAWEWMRPIRSNLAEKDAR